MKILRIFKVDDEKYRITYRYFFGISVKRYAFLNGQFNVDFSWLDTGESVGNRINSILKYMHRNNITEIDTK